MYGEGADPRNATLKTGTTVSGPGLLLTMDGTSNTLDVCADGEVALGVSAGESERAAGGALKTAAGATVSYYPMGGVLMIATEGSQTYTTGLVVYAGASGQCIDSNDHTSKAIGVYVGEGDVEPAAGTLIPINTSTAVNA